MQLLFICQNYYFQLLLLIGDNLFRQRCQNVNWRDEIRTIIFKASTNILLTITAIGSVYTIKLDTLKKLETSFRMENNSPFV